MNDDTRRNTDADTDQQPSPTQPSNPANFANDPQRASDAGRKGGQVSGQNRQADDDQEAEEDRPTAGGTTTVPRDARGGMHGGMR